MTPIPVVIVIMIVIFVGLVFMDFTKLLTLRDEIQGDADVAAAGALSYALNANEVFDENMTVNESLAKKKFEQLFADSMTTYMDGRQLVSGYNVRRVSIRNAAGSTVTEGDRSQYICEAIVSVEFTRLNLIDYVANVGLRYRDVLAGGRVEISEGQTNERGKVLVRGAARVILR